MIFLKRGRLSNRLCSPAVPLLRRRSSPALLTRTRLTCGRLDFTGRRLLLPERILGFAGLMTRSSLITAAGTEQTRITIKTGTTPFTTAWGTHAGMIRQSLATISSMERIPSLPRLAMTAVPTRSAWRPAQSGSVAVTWTRATAHQPGTSSAWNFSWRLTHSAARRTKATRPKRLILPTTRGVARLRRVVAANTLQAAVEAQGAAGIQMVVAAGNCRLRLFHRCPIRHRFMRLPTR